MESVIDRLAIERACERLVLDFAYYSDHQEYEPLAQLFAADGIMERPGMASVVGREAILQAYRARPAGRMTRHVCSNIRITGIRFAVDRTGVCHRTEVIKFSVILR